MIKARASGSKVYLYFIKKGRQARHRIPRNSCVACTMFSNYRAPGTLLFDKAMASVMCIVFVK